MLSIVIATHADPLGLYMTVFSTLQQMYMFPFSEWEIVIAADGGSEYKWEKIQKVRCLRGRTGSPQGTRDMGIREAKFSTVLCIESHVVVFEIHKWLMLHHTCGNPALSFPARIGEGPELFSVFGSTTDWDGTLWYKKHLYNHMQDQPYRIAQFGHSAFMVNRNWYLQSGGYTDLQKGFGGEEQFLCLKAWMLGSSCWMIPTVHHAHYLTPGAHPNMKESEDFKRNIEIVKYVMTGTANLQLTPELIAERQKICAGPFGGDLEKLKTYFKSEGIIG